MLEKRFIGASERRAIFKKELTKVLTRYGKTDIRWSGLEVAISVEVVDKTDKKFSVNIDHEINWHMIYACKDSELKAMIEALVNIISGRVREKIRQRCTSEYLGYVSWNY